MKNFIYFYLVAIYFASNACNSAPLSEKINYYKVINQAENHIMNLNYIEASKKYDQAFKLKSKMFGLDLYNALLCNLYLKDWKNCEFWASKLLDKGIDIQFFIANRFNEFRKTEEWLNLQIKYAKSKAKVNSFYKRQLDSLVVEDQKSYCLIQTGDLIYNDVKVNTVVIEDRFASFINSYGFPNEERMGINVVNDTLISFVPSYVSLLRHGYQSGNAKLAKLFKQALENGTLDRRIFESTLNDNSDFALYEGTMYIRKERLIEEDSVREKKLKFVNK